MSPVNSMKLAAQDSNRSSKWQIIGWGGILAGILILSFYSVAAGWAFSYIFEVYFFQFLLLCLFFGLLRVELPILVLFLIGVKYSLEGVLAMLHL